MRLWWLRLLRYSRPSLVTLSAIVLLIVVGATASALTPWPMKWLVDRVLRGGGVPSWFAAFPGAHSPAAQAAWLAGAMVIIFIINQSASVARNYLLNGFGNRAAYQLGARLFDHLQALSVLFHTRRAAADLVRRVTTDSACARDLLVSVLIPLLSSVATLGCMFALMYRLDWILAWVAIGVILPLGIVMKVAYAPMSRRAFEQQEAESAVMTVAERTFSAVPLVQLFNREHAGDETFRQCSDRAQHSYLATIVAQLQFKMGTGMVMALGTAAVMVVGGWHALDGKLTLGGLLVFLAYCASFYGPLEAMAYLSSTLGATRANAQRVLEVLDSKQDVCESPSARPLAMRKGQGLWVRFEKVTFGYERDQAVLHEVSLEALPGQTVALVGPTGAGKTTLLSLLPRLFDPWEGRVSLGGMDLRDLKLSDVRRAVAVVPQEPILLPMSIAQNIAYGNPQASREQIEAAAEAAHALEFIERLPAGYETTIGERGCTLSAGQRQRIAIARALLRESSVLVLDEPTSALDAESERLVMSALRRLCEGRTCFVIAHRLSTVQSADRVVVLNDGRVADEGSPNELAGRAGLYRRFLELQLGRPAVAVS